MNPFDKNLKEMNALIDRMSRSVVKAFILCFVIPLVCFALGILVGYMMRGQ